MSSWFVGVWELNWGVMSSVFYWPCMSSYSVMSFLCVCRHLVFSGWLEEGSGRQDSQVFNHFEAHTSSPSGTAQFSPFVVERTWNDKQISGVKCLKGALSPPHLPPLHPPYFNKFNFLKECIYVLFCNSWELLSFKIPFSKRIHFYIKTFVISFQF